MTAPHDLPPQPDAARRITARTELIVAILIGFIVAVPVALLSSAEFATLVGWDAAIIAYMTWVWLMIWPLDAPQTARRAKDADPTRAATDLLLLTAAAASLVAVGLLLVGAAQGHGPPERLRVGLGVSSVILSWAVVHTVFTLRYARLYYTDPDGGINFNQPDPPGYSDFAYLAFTIGMTFQVSDTDLQTRQIRRTAMRHALLSYLFGTGVLATTINLVASLGSK